MKYLRNVFNVAVLLCGLSTAAQAACRNDALASRNGDLLVTRSGDVYRILENAARAAFWLPLGRLIICEHVAVDAASGERVSIYDIRNQDDNELVKAVRER